MKIVFRLSFLLLAIFFVISNANGVSIGIAPSVIDFGDLQRGQSAQAGARIYNTQDISINFSVDAEDFSEWIKVLDTDGNEIKSFTIPPKGVVELIIRISVPEDAANGYYIIPVYFVSNPEGGGVSISSKTPLTVEVTVSGVQKKSVKLMLFKVEDTEVNIPARMEVHLMNDGNVVADPLIELTVFNPEGIEVWKNQTKVTISPRDIGQFKFNWDAKMAEVGEHKCRLKIILDGNEVISDIQSFDVFEKGTLTARIEILNVSVEQTVKIGQLTKFSIEVKNTGQIDTETRLKIEVYRNGELFDLAEAEPLWIEKGNTGILTAYLRFPDSGEYILKPLIFFGGKIAKLSEIKVNAVSGESELQKTDASEENQSKTQMPGFSALIALLALIVIAGMKWSKGR